MSAAATLHMPANGASLRNTAGSLRAFEDTRMTLAVTRYAGLHGAGAPIIRKTTHDDTIQGTGGWLWLAEERLQRGFSTSKAVAWGGGFPGDSVPAASADHPADAG